MSGILATAGRPACQTAARGFTLAQLKQLWPQARPGSVWTWDAVKGPLSATVMSARRIGWRFKGPFEILLPSDAVIDLRTHSPALVKRLAVDAWVSKTERDLASKWLSTTGWGDVDEPRNALHAVERSDEHEATAPAPTAIRHVVRSRATPRPVAQGLLSVATDAVWTKQRLCDHGLAVDGICIKCSRGADTVHHRAWTCTSLADIRQKHATPEQIRRARANPASLLWTRGWLPSAAELAPAPSDLELRGWSPVGGEEELTEGLGVWAGLMTGYVFIDGSADTPEDRRRRRAGWSCVEVEPYLINGALVRKRAVWGTIPASWPQSSQAAEQAAAVAASELVGPGAIVFSDCQAVIDLMRAPPRRALRSQQLWAGAYRTAMTFPCGAKAMRDLRKVKAHQEEQSGESPTQRLLRLGNDWADAKAKEGAVLHARMRDAMVSLLRRQWDDALSACRVIGEATTLWPAAAQLRDGLPRRPTTRAQRRAAATARETSKQLQHAMRTAQQRHDHHTHSWVGVGSRLRCAACFSWAGADVAPCSGLPPAWANWLAVARAQGHRLRLGHLHDAEEQGVAFAICLACGSWTATAGRAAACRLQGSCAGHTTSAGAEALRRVARGRHPKAGRHPRWCALYSGQ